jgi:hypothetical protein
VPALPEIVGCFIFSSLAEFYRMRSELANRAFGYITSHDLEKQFYEVKNGEGENILDGFASSVIPQLNERDGLVEFRFLRSRNLRAAIPRS